MISFLAGRLSAAFDDQAVIDVGGIGFSCQIPLSTRAKLPPPGEECRLHTRLLWRDDGPALYGFATPAEAEVFDLLIRVSGVGPKIAVAVLSGASPDSVLEALALEDVESLRRFPGIGKKTAERMVLELKDRVSASLEGQRLAGADRAGAGAPASRAGQLVQALLGLGYSRAEATLALDALPKGALEGASEEELIRRALQHLASR